MRKVGRRVTTIATTTTPARSRKARTGTMKRLERTRWYDE